jgi:transporter family-2 protein
MAALERPRQTGIRWREERESVTLYSALAPLIGAVITIMNLLNSRFSGLVGTLIATLVIHVVGLAAVSAILLVKREHARPEPIPFYYYLGGFVGVWTVFSAMYAFSMLGASLAVALGLLGQTLLSVATDATGLLGRRKYPLSARSLPGIAMAIAGVAIMAGNWRSDAPAMLVGLASGVLPGLTFIINSELGLRKGNFHATRINYIGGLATTLLIIAVIRLPASSAAAAVEAVRGAGAAGPILVLGGGLTGVAVVSGINFVFPRIPAFSATLLMFSGQAVAGIVIDAVVSGAFDIRKIVGTVVLLAGLAAHALLSRKEAVPAPRRDRAAPGSRYG